MNTKTIQRIKEAYRPGIAVRLITMHKESQMPEGLKGKVDIEELILEAENYIANGINGTQKSAVSTNIPYKTGRLLDAFLSAHVMTDEDAGKLKIMANFSENESEEAQCPKCGSDQLDYGSAEIEENSVLYPWTCGNCGSEGKEYGKIVFDGHYVDNSPYFEESQLK